jgi:hypothetical protein
VPAAYLCLANCYFAHDSSGFPILLLFFDAQSGRSCYPLDRYAGPVARTGGVRSLVAESLLLKHQLLSINLLISSLESINRFGQVYGTSDASKTQSGLIVNRSRQRSPNLSAGDRILAGLLALLVRPTRLLRVPQLH